MTIKQLQNKENKLWSALQATCEDEELDLIAELLEVTIELEQLSNQ